MYAIGPPLPAGSPTLYVEDKSVLHLFRMANQLTTIFVDPYTSSMLGSREREQGYDANLFCTTQSGSPPFYHEHDRLYQTAVYAFFDALAYLPDSLFPPREKESLYCQSVTLANAFPFAYRSYSTALMSARCIPLCLTFGLRIAERYARAEPALCSTLYFSHAKHLANTVIQNFDLLVAAVRDEQRLCMTRGPDPRRIDHLISLLSDLTGIIFVMLHKAYLEKKVEQLSRAILDNWLSSSHQETPCPLYFNTEVTIDGNDPTYRSIKAIWERHDKVEDDDGPWE